MTLARFKLKKADASTQLATFDKQPNWRDLVTEISLIFGIPPDNVIVSHVDKDKETITLHNEEELQHFYKSLGPSSESIKFVVQDIKVPDLAITSTWSKDSGLSDISKSDDKLDLFCLVLNGSKTLFSVAIGERRTVDCLKKVIKKDMEPELDHWAASSITLWKLSLPIPSNKIRETLGHVRSPKEILGCVILDPLGLLSEYFPSPPSKHLHIIVELPSAGADISASRKRLGLSPMEEDNRVTKRGRIAESVIEKKWTVNGAIREIDKASCYYLDPGTQSESTRCLVAVSTRQFALLWGARASGKTTRLLWLRKKLISMGYQALYISFESIRYDADLDAFWKSFGRAVTAAAATSDFGLPQGSTTVSSQDEFLELLRADAWRQNVVLLIDELSELYNAPTCIRDAWLRVFRVIRNNNEIYAIHSVIGAGTFDIVNLNPSNSTISPFNVADCIQNPYFTVEEVRKLFYEFAQGLHITIDDTVVEDIWAKSNGHPAMVCLCGRTVFKNLPSLLDSDLANVSYRSWQQFPADTLYSEISAYNTFGSMLTSLARPQAAAAVTLLRSCFLGFLDEVQLNNNVERDLADFLTSEGVLLKPGRPHYYCMASPLLDGIIRNTLIPRNFPDSPSSVPPLEDGGKGPHVLGILIESLKFFDKALIRLAVFRSYKTPKVKIPSVPDGRVPRESVYDTELMRILSNWLRNRYNWTVTGQWHLQTDTKKHKFSDIVIKRQDDPMIVLEILATGDTSFVRSHIQKTPEYMALLSANEAWVVHFTCERDYHPIWQSDEELSGGINVVHFVHDLDFTNVVMSTRWKDRAGNIWHEDRRLLMV